MKKETEQGPATRNLAPNAGGIEAGSDNNTVSVVWYVNQMSMRNGLASPWSIEAEYLSVIQTGLHRHRTRDGIKGISRMCFGQLGRHADASEVDIGGSISAGETSQT